MDESGPGRSTKSPFKVGEWLVQPDLRRLVGPAGEAKVEARSMDVLVVMAEEAGEILSRQDLLERVWGERSVGEEALSHAIWDLRRALGDESKTPQFIQTIHRKGYRLIAKVSWLAEAPGDPTRYILEEKIARGTIGVIWRAHDPRLDRTVAIKFLATELCRTRSSKARFLREARAAARLDHPNICTVYEVDETDEGRMYLVMPLYEGETLEERLLDGAISWQEAVSIAIDIASGLHVAHHAGIVHRDLKPGNIMLTPAPAMPGQEPTTVTKILDFGLSKLQGATRLTVAGTSLGTPAYMSPELARQEDAGPANDLWALGVLLFEMLTGHCPFRGANAQAVIHGIINNDPEPLPDNVAIPDELRSLIRGLLAKHPNDRPSDSGELAAALRGLLAHDTAAVRALATPERTTDRTDSKQSRKGLLLGLLIMSFASITIGWAYLVRQQAPALSASNTPHASALAKVSVEEQSIAVLAFADMSQNKDQAYLSDGLAEELLNLLTRVPELRVTARTSAFSFKGSNLGISEIARRLRVSNILEGSVRVVGDQVRITVQLIDPASEKNRWAETYHRTLDDIFGIQDEIAAAVVEELKIELLGEVPTLESTHPEAYPLLLQARHVAGLETTASWEKAIELYRKALAIDPDSPSILVGLSSAYNGQTNIGLRPVDEGFRLARELASKALAIDPSFAPAHVRLSYIARVYDHDLALSAKHAKRALQLEPNDPSVLAAAAQLARDLDRPALSVALKEHLVALDPVSGGRYGSLAQSYYFAGRMEAALDASHTAMALRPSGFLTRYSIGAIHLLEGRPAAALPFMQEEQSPSFQLGGLAMVYHALGRTEESTAALRRLMDKYERTSSYNIAYILAYLGEADRAFEWLAKAVEYNDSGLHLVPLEPLFANIHTDPRWLPFLSSIGRAPEQLAAIELEVALPE